MGKPEKSIFGSRILSDTIPKEVGSDYWRTLFYLNIYRMLLSVFLITTSLATINIGSLGSKNPEVFAYTSFFYGFLSLLFAYSIHKSWPRYLIQCRLQILADIIIIIILYYSSGGRGAGLEILLFVSISSSGILLGGRGALTAASAATIFLILEHFYVIATNQRPMGGFTTLGFIGSGLFVTAFVIYYLSLLLRRTEVEVAQQNINIKKLSHINELIVEQLHSGVIVVSPSFQVLLINDSGRELLDIHDGLTLPLSLNDILNIAGLDESQLKNSNGKEESMLKLSSGKKLMTRYRPLGKSYDDGYIILIDDYSQIEQKQRNEKFISMGRLSASIAHEIRNPLGAISHAGQLLAESPSINNEDIRLVEIIENQSMRINQTIQSILEIGQENDFKLQEIDLHSWLSSIIKTFRTIHSLSDSAILLEGSRTKTAFGASDQLQHVIQNILENALRFADMASLPCITISIEQALSTGNSTICIRDNGPGISQDIQDKIFEPFFTTSPTGNGLGLYIARKICLSNGGHLEYITPDNDSSYFMLTLGDNENVQPHYSC